jgi:serine/threonine-protein kinase
MSPEQALGEAAIDGRSDIYSLGCVLYEMLTGAPPFSGPTCQFSIAKTVMEAPVAPRVFRDTIPRSTEEVVLKALAKLPVDRFRTAGEFSCALAASTKDAKSERKSAEAARIDDRLRPS